VVTNHTVLVSSRDGGWYLQRFARHSGIVGSVAGGQQFRHMLEDLAVAALRRVKSQLDGRYRACGNRYPVDLRGAKGALDKAPAERAVRLTEQPRAFHSDHSIPGEHNLHVDVGCHIRSRLCLAHAFVLADGRGSRADRATLSSLSASAELVHSCAPAVTKPVHDRVLLRQRLRNEHRCVDDAVS
jgi:hypothetical protein